MVLGVSGLMTTQAPNDFTENTMIRFYIISESHGLVATAHDPEQAERIALIAAVKTGRTVQLHDRMTEV